MIFKSVVKISIERMKHRAVIFALLVVGQTVILTLDRLLQSKNDGG